MLLPKLKTSINSSMKRMIMATMAKAPEWVGLMSEQAAPADAPQVRHESGCC
jgi:hypothetical protein